MIPRVSEWLPTDALTHPRFDKELGDALQHWNDRWLAAAPGYKTSCAKYIGNRSVAVTALDWRGLGHGISIGWNDEFAAAVGAVLVDATDKSLAKTARDKNLLSALAMEAFEDLASSIAASLNLPDKVGFSGRAGEPAIEWSLRATGKTMLPQLVLRIPASLLVPARKAMIGSAQYALPDACSLTDACASASLSVRAEVGEAVIGWRDLQRLEIGDVVVLDRKMSDKFALLTDESDQTICGLNLVQDEGSLRLLAAN